MAKTRKRRRASRPRHASAVNRRRRRSNPVRYHRRRSVVRHRRHNPRRVVIMRANRRRRRNPSFMGSNVKPMKMVELVAAGAVSMGLNSLALTFLPDTITTSTPMSVAASAAIALAMGWGVGMWDKEVGAAVTFGGLMNSVKIGVNAFIPSVGAAVGLSGRGTGDFVNGLFAVPENPVMRGNPQIGGPAGGGASMAYPLPYAA